MKEILIFRHVAVEGPGYLGEFLDSHDIRYRIVKIDQNDPVPESIADISGLVFMGGPMSVNDDLPWIAPELALIRRAVAAGIPVLGHCLGGQLMSKALGGTITRNPVREIGWLPVAQVPGNAAHDWLDDLLPEFDVFHWHGETFSIPPGATRILESRHCANQAFVIGNSLAMQCHVEMLAPMIAEWVAKSPDDVAAPSATVQTLAQMQMNLDVRIASLQHVANSLYTRWIQGLA